MHSGLARLSTHTSTHNSLSWSSATCILHVCGIELVTDLHHREGTKIRNTLGYLIALLDLFRPIRTCGSSHIHVL